MSNNISKTKNQKRFHLPTKVRENSRANTLKQILTIMAKQNDIHSILKTNGLKLEGFERTHDGYLAPVVTDIETGKRFKVPGDPKPIRFSESFGNPIIAIPRDGGIPYVLKDEKDENKPKNPKKKNNGKKENND